MIVLGILLSIAIFLISIDNHALGIEPQSLYFGKEINISMSSGASELPQVTSEGNNVYVVWQDNTTGNYDIDFAHSVDNGANFGPVINLSKNSGASELPQVTSEGNNVYVVWQDNTTGNYDIDFAHSVDNGANFGPVINLSKNSGASELPQVTSEGNNVYVVWQDNTTGNYDIYFAHSVDNGANFGPVINLSKNSGASELPQVTSEGNNVYVVWQDNTTGNYDIYFAHSVDNGANFGPVINLSKNSGASELPQVTSEGNNVYVVWQDNTTGNYDIYFKSSSTNGTNFKSIRNLSKNSGASEFPQIEPDKNVFYVIWKDRTGGMDRIFFKEGQKDYSTNNTEFGSTKKISSNGNVSKPSISAGSSHISSMWISNFANSSVIGYYPLNFFVDSNNAIQITKLLPKDNIGSISIFAYKTDIYCVWESKEVAKSEIIFKRISTQYFD